jgi:GntR family transcriptional regulator, transcriptional repressor for pyruvate dehydrogenase complex
MGDDTGPQTREESRIEKLSERVVRQIVLDITTAAGGPAVGFKLPSEAEMSSLYGVGRGTLREALRMLEAQGLITIKSGPGGGAVVTGRSPRRLGATAARHLQVDGVTLGSVADARLKFEPFFAWQAARNASPAETSALMALVDEASFAGNNRRSDLQRTSAFHAAVMDCAGNSVLALLGACLKEIWTGAFRGLLYPLPEQARVRADHFAIARAIQAGDADAAEGLMQAHMEEWVTYARRRFSSLLAEVVEWR